MIPLENRVQLVNDIFAFARNGILDATKPLDLLDYFKNETEMFLCRIALSQLKEIIDLIQDTNLFKGFKNYLLKFFNSFDVKNYNQNNKYKGFLYF